MELILIIIVLLLLFGGGWGYYQGNPNLVHSGGIGLGTVLLIILIVMLLRGRI